jgi:hypothetical protein
MFHICRPVWVKFGGRRDHNSLMLDCEFCINISATKATCFQRSFNERVSELHSLLSDLDEMAWKDLHFIEGFEYLRLS